jgi:hypothetical protein
MMPTRELLQQALDALERCTEYMETPVEQRKSQPYVEAEDAAIAIRAHLSAPEPEPVAWWVFHEDGSAHIFQQKETADIFGASVPLYTHPAPAVPDQKDQP